jgi:hypothetical protein
MREGRQAVGQAGKARAPTVGSGKSAQTEGTQPTPKRGRAGRASAGASASANASEVACGRGCMDTMRDACKRANRQVGGTERDRSCGEGHHAGTHPTDTVKGMDSSDAEGITTGGLATTSHAIRWSSELNP